MKFVTTCSNCFKSFVPSTDHEWCRPCADHFQERLDPIVNAAQDAIDNVVDGPHAPIIFTDDFNAQPDPAKLEAAHEQLQELELNISHIQTDPVRTNAKHIPSEDLESTEGVRARELEFKSKRPTATATETALRNEAKPGWWEQLEVAPGNDPPSSEPGAIDYSTLAPGRAVIVNRPVYISPAMDDIITKHVAAVQEKLQRELSKILHKGIETNDLRYASKEYNLGFKREKSEKF